MNLLNETKKILKVNNKTEKDILWIGNECEKMSWEQFVKYADKEYDDGYGVCEVAEDLFVVGKDFWLERRDYDGAEWWEYKTIPREPMYTVNGKRIMKVIWGVYGV